MLALVGFIGLCLLVAATDASLARHSLIAWYLSLTRPPGTLPNGVLVTMWATAYVILGTAAWLVWRHAGAGPALRMWGWQVAANALWAPAFFGVHQIALALAVIVVLLILAASTLLAFRRQSQAAGWLMLPYLAWIGYVTYLNAGFWCLNGV